MKTLTNRAPFFIFVAVLFFGLSGGALWYVGYYTAKNKKTAQISSFAECVAAGNPVMQSYPEQCAAQGKTFSSPQQSVKTTDTVTSGKEGFSVALPRGWGQFLNASDDDRLILMGTAQPKTDVSKPVEVKNTPFYGSDGPVLLMIGFGSYSDWAPRGTESPFTIGKDKRLLDGKKYVYEYPAYEEVGIGIPRHKGDKEYQYVFSLTGNRQLTVTYNVYSDDPNDQVETIDNIVRSVYVTTP